MDLFCQWAEIWAREYRAAVSYLAPQGSEPLRRFWILFVSGHGAGEGAWFWLKSFRELYILHLLVLSGSQVESLGRLVRRLLVGLRFEVARLLLSLVVVAFAVATGLGAPIVRASTVGLVSLWRPRWALLGTLLFSFLFQYFCFAHHRDDLGFYLSWLAYLAVLAAGKIRVSKSVSIALVSGLIFIILETLVFGRAWTPADFLICVLANVIFCWIFELFFMPVASIYIALALALGALRLAGWEFVASGEFLALWTRPLVQALLVVLKSLMYT